jgi:hypothetical protein
VFVSDPYEVASTAWVSDIESVSPDPQPSTIATSTIAAALRM